MLHLVAPRGARRRHHAADTCEECRPAVIRRLWCTSTPHQHRAGAARL